MEKIFKALGDKTRLEILILIGLNPDICLCHIEDCFSLSNSNLSRHLKEIENASLVNTHKIGKWKHYQLSEIGNQLIELIKNLDNHELYNSVQAKNAVLNKEPKC